MPGEAAFLNRLRLTTDFSHISITRAITIAVAAVAGFTLVRELFLQVLGTRVAFITCYPAVILAAQFGGFRSGLLATALSAMAASYLWMYPTGHISIAHPADILSVLIFVVIGISISWITDSMNRFRSRAAEAEAHVRILEVAADQQRRIGQELHDGTGQELTGLTLFSSTLVDLLNQGVVTTENGKSCWSLDEGDLLAIHESAGKLLKGLVASNRNVQLLSRGIMPIEIEADGLKSALQELASTTDGLQSVTCDFDCPAPVRISNSTVATHLYRIAQEAVANALRHSWGNQIEIGLYQFNDQIVLQIRDNGIGFDPATIAKPGPQTKSAGFGLGIMSFRAASMGGNLLVRSESGNGTLIKCTIPQTTGG